MLSILTVVLPVFFIVGTGYAAVKQFGFKDVMIDGIMAYTLRIALPLLLFRAIVGLDLGQAFDGPTLAVFYGGAFASYALAMLLARVAFRRRPGEAAAIGFCALFSNTLLLGLPILERAYGPGPMPVAYSIISLHAPVMYAVGITVMEILRSDGAGPMATAQRAGKAIFSNALTIGILAGFAVNLSGLPVPTVVMGAVDLIANSALPTALFALGGALTRYALRDDLGEAVMTAVVSTLFHPGLVWVLAVPVLALPTDYARAAVVIAAMPAGMNGYMFATMYNRAQGAAASTVLLATGLSVLTVTFWLWVLGGAAG